VLGWLCQRACAVVPLCWLCQQTVVAVDSANR